MKGMLKSSVYNKGVYIMKTRINMITIWTDTIEPMKKFYSEVLGFEVKLDLNNYIEFENDGVRFAICLRSVMYDYTSIYREKTTGQGFELAFECESSKELEQTYKTLVEKGAVGIHEPQKMPWNQITALFADPDGNIHELFTEL